MVRYDRKRFANSAALAGFRPYIDAVLDSHFLDQEMTGVGTRGPKEELQGIPNLTFARTRLQATAKLLDVGGVAPVHAFLICSGERLSRAREMSEVEGSVILPSEGVGRPQGGPGPAWGRARRLLREIVAIWVWLYVVLKLFVFDFDIYLIDLLAPNLRWLLDFKILIILAALAIVSMVSNKKGFLLFAAYVASYPIILICWRVPWLILKQKSWVLFFALVNFGIGFLQSIRYTLVSSALYLICFALALLADARPILYGASVGLLIILGSAFLRRFAALLRGDKLFQFYHRAVPWIRSKAILLVKMDESVRNLPVASMDEKQIATWTTSLEQSVLINRILLFSARKVRDHQKSAFGVVLGVIATIFLWVATVVTFTAINVAAYKIDPTGYSANSPPTFFTFFNYSFKAMFIASITELTPISLMAKSIEMLNNFFAFLTFAIIAAAFIAVYGQTYNSRLDELIATLEREGEEAESFIRSEFRFNSIDDALAELTRLKSGLLNILLLLTRNLK